jgi:hypothetical protein
MLEVNNCLTYTAHLEMELSICCDIIIAVYGATANIAEFDSIFN